ncbi:MAG: PaaI family thioesterase [Halobacteriales archaeon]
MTDGVPHDRRQEIADDPFCDLLGIELVELAPGAATTRLTLTEELVNFHGIPHGGAIYALADAAFAAASNADGRTAIALDTNISYLEAVDVGTELTARAEERQRGGRTGAFAVDVTDSDDEPIAIFRGRGYEP